MATFAGSVHGVVVQMRIESGAAPAAAATTPVRRQSYARGYPGPA